MRESRFFKGKNAVNVSVIINNNKKNLINSERRNSLKKKKKENFKNRKNLYKLETLLTDLNEDNITNENNPILLDFQKCKV